MGGRGSFSATHGGMAASAGGAGSIYVSGQTESRADIRQMFIGELGFRELYGTEAIPTAQLGAIGNELRKYERIDHVLANNDVYLAVTDKADVKGAAALMNDGSMVLFLNPSTHTSVSDYRSALRSEQGSGFKTATDGSVTSDFSYTARHEYGHLVGYQAERQTGKSAAHIRSEVQAIARSGYNASSSSPSSYGSTSAREYFAESYASLTGGSPNAHGSALGDWLDRNTR